VIFFMRVLITGGAGFIRPNAVHRFLQRGAQVTLYDDLSRRGSISSLDWLRTRHGAESFRLIQADLREADRLAEAARGQDVILHWAGQVAVTTSVQNPRGDLEDNAPGTFNAIYTRPTAVPRAPATSTCAIARSSTAYARWCFANRRSTARAGWWTTAACLMRETR
jgi:CDP-paratose 2-epimerase